jgi:hypothetical protein
MLSRTGESNVFISYKRLGAFVKLATTYHKRAEKRSCRRRLTAREPEYILLLTLTAMALEIDRRD